MLLPLKERVDAVVIATDRPLVIVWQFALSDGVDWLLVFQQFRIQQHFLLHNLSVSDLLPLHGILQELIDIGPFVYGPGHLRGYQRDLRRFLALRQLLSLLRPLPLLVPSVPGQFPFQA